MTNTKFINAMEEDINQANIPEFEKQKLMTKLLMLKERKINLMITGATGCGKSSTINALFNAEKAKVGVGVDPETMDIQKYELDNLILWDTPGLGDGKEADNRHAKNIVNKLLERDADGNLVIDLVLVILDGGSRDLGTSYELINQVIIPNLGEDKTRLLVAINQCDVAMKGRHWDYENNRPEPPLVSFLEEKVVSVKNRIKEATGVDVDPIYYSAGYKDGDNAQNRPYNLSKLLYYIVRYTPKEKRLVYIDNINRDKEMWEDDDDLVDYRKGILESFVESVRDCVSGGGEIGEALGEALLGRNGGTIGRAVGSAVGGVVGAVKGVFSALGSLFG